MKLTYSKVDELYNSLLSVPVKGESILIAAENMAKLKPFIDVILSIKTKLINQHTNGKETINSNHPKWESFVNDYNKSLQKEVDVNGLTKLKKKDLDFERGMQTNIQGFVANLLSSELLE